MNFVSRALEGFSSYLWGNRQTGQDGGSSEGQDWRQTEATSEAQHRAYQRARDGNGSKASAPAALPILQEVEGHGGFQGLSWYTAKKKQDEHGDLADEFYYEEPTDSGGGPLKPKKMKGARQKQLAVDVISVDEGNVGLVHSKKSKQES